MRKPSRFMPKYEPKQMGPFSWLFFVSILILFGYLVYKHPLVIVLLPVVYIASIISTKSHKSKLSKLALGRENEDIGTFAKAFNYREIDTWVIRAVYEQIQDYLKEDYPNFPLRPDDKVYDDLILDPDDFDMDILNEISQRTGRSLEKLDKNPYAQSLETVKDVVDMFNSQPKSSNAT